MNITEIKKQALVLGNKSIFAGFFCILLHGCGSFQKANPPAPIYKKSTVTNPYQQQKPPVVITKSESGRQQIDNVGESFKTAKPKQPLSIDSANTNLRIVEPDINRPLTPAVLALVTKADTSSKQGDLETAVATLERALRIDSRNPALTYKLAVIRLKQAKPRLAEDLAKKTALLSANNKELKRKSWLLISEARKRQNNLLGAKEAILKANSI